MQPAVSQHRQLLFHPAAFQPLFPKPVGLHRVLVTQVLVLVLNLGMDMSRNNGHKLQPEKF